MDLYQLQELKKQGYETLYRKNDKQYFIPLSITYENLLTEISQTPMMEDELIDISCAIDNYIDYEEYLTTILVIYIKNN